MCIPTDFNRRVVRDRENFPTLAHLSSRVFRVREELRAAAIKVYESIEDAGVGEVGSSSCAG